MKQGIHAVRRAGLEKKIRNYKAPKEQGPTHFGGNKLDLPLCNRPGNINNVKNLFPDELVFPTDHHINIYSIILDPSLELFFITNGENLTKFEVT